MAKWLISASEKSVKKLAVQFSRYLKNPLASMYFSGRKMGLLFLVKQLIYEYLNHIRKKYSYAF